MKKLAYGEARKSAKALTKKKKKFLNFPICDNDETPEFSNWRIVARDSDKTHEFSNQRIVARGSDENTGIGELENGCGTFCNS